MVDLAVRVVINAVALVVAVLLVPGVEFTGGLAQLAAMGLVFGVINGFLRPIVKLLSLPLTIITFGLIGFVINTGLVILAALVSERLNLGFTLGGWPPGQIDADVLIAAFGTSVVLSIVSTAVALARKVVPGI
jgi:putative membrane protein